MNKRTVTLLVLLTLIASALWFLGSWRYYTKLKCKDCDEITLSQAGDSDKPLTSGTATSGALTGDVPKNQDSVKQAIADNTPVVDSDGDGLSDDEEKKIGTDPQKGDSDGDGIPDNEELGAELSMPIDTDKDGIIDALDADDDNDTVPTLIEGEIGTSPLLKDTDGDGLDDAEEIGDISNANTSKTIKALDTDEDGTINALDIDDDDDGLDTASELLVGTNHLLADTDSDGIPDNVEIGATLDQVKDSDSDGIIDALDNQDNTDTDNDGVPDVLEASLGLDATKSDSDDDGIDDIEEIGDDYNQPLDTDEDGIINPLDPDDDGDTLTTLFESNIGTNPLSPDSDDDGISDAAEVGDDRNNILDTDADGIINPLDRDDDNDGRDTRLELSLNTDPLKADTQPDTEDNKQAKDQADEKSADTKTASLDRENSDSVLDKKATEKVAEKAVETEQQIPAADTKTTSSGSGESDTSIAAEAVTEKVTDTDDEKAADSEQQISETSKEDKKVAVMEGEPQKAQLDSQEPQTVDTPADKAEEGKITAEVFKEGDTNTPQSMRLYFPFNSQKPEISTGLANYFKKIVSWLNEDPGHVIQISGHTDNVGSAKANLALGIRRVMEIREFLIEAGAPYQQIDFLSRGESEPIADNKTEEGRLRNRRVEISPILTTN